MDKRKILRYQLIILQTEKFKLENELQEITWKIEDINRELKTGIRIKELKNRLKLN